MIFPVPDVVPTLTEGDSRGFEAAVKSEFTDEFSDRLMSAVAAMPRQELATMAEVLVSLTAFRAHASVGQETVAGPIDVAILSKGDGFVWVKRKRCGDER